MKKNRSVKKAEERVRLRRLEQLLEKGVTPDAARAKARGDAERFARTLGEYLATYKEQIYYDVNLHICQQTCDYQYADMKAGAYANAVANHILDLISDVIADVFIGKDIDTIENIIQSILSNSFGIMRRCCDIRISAGHAKEVSCMELATIYSMLVTDEITLDEAAKILYTTPETVRELIKSFRGLYSKDPYKQIKQL